MAEQRKCKKLVAVLVEHQEHFGVMSDEDCQWAIQNPKDAVVLFADAVRNRGGVEVKKLLERLSVTIALPVVVQFVAAEKFRPGETIDGIRVGWLGDNFREHFLSKTESGEVASEKLAVNKLLKGSRDPAIITALGGEEKVEISLGQFWEFLKTVDQKFWYVVYIRDTEGVLWAVDADWGSGGLRVGAGSLDYPDGWYADYRFLSR